MSSNTAKSFVTFYPNNLKFISEIIQEMPLQSDQNWKKPKAKEQSLPNHQTYNSTTHVNYAFDTITSAIFFKNQSKVLYFVQLFCFYSTAVQIIPLFILQTVVETTEAEYRQMTNFFTAANKVLQGRRRVLNYCTHWIKKF